MTMVERLKVFAGWAVLFVLAVYVLGRLGPREPDPVRTVNGVRMEEVGLAGLVPAVAGSDAASGRCNASRRLPNGMGTVAMSFPAAPDEIRQVTVMLDSAGALHSYSELRHTGKTITSIMIDAGAGTGGMTNVTEEGARVMIGRGTADEALRSEALGSPARMIQTMLARCGRPGETADKS
ncbi:MAG TPA: hypothetical protein VF006_03730 [Longimicrobium sp.]